MPDHFHIRLLTAADGADYQRLRLSSLQQNPQAFVTDFETESKLHEQQFAGHLDWAYHPPHFGYFGVFEDEKLIGYVQVGRTFSDKQAHIANINNLYICPEYRGKGIATLLFQHIFDTCDKSEHLERLYLTCRASNKPALRLYQKLGFRRYGVKTRSVKWQGQYDDEVEFVKILKSEN